MMTPKKLSSSTAVVFARRKKKKELSDFITENKLTVKHLLCTHLHTWTIFSGIGFIYKTYGLSPQATGSTWNNSLHPTNRRRHSTPGHFQEIPVQKQLVGNEVVKFGHSELLVLTVP